MKNPEHPVTAAVRAMRRAGIAHTPLFYDYVERGGTSHAAHALGLDEHAVVKTLVMEVQEPRKRLLVVLMHGDREVSTKQLARILNVKGVAPAQASEVTKGTGYLPGGVSPFGTRTPLPVYVEESILAYETIYLNGGKRGFLVAIAPGELIRVLGAIPVQVAIERRVERG